MFSHDISGGLFSDYAEVGAKNENSPGSKLFSILGKLEDYRNGEGKFRFKLCYPELTWGSGGSKCNEWIQTSNPYTDSTITGFEAVSLAFDVDSERNDWRGLGKNVPKWEEFTAIDDDPDSEGYFSSLGAYSIWTQGSIAGPRHPTSSDGIFSFVTKVELYVIT